MVSAANSAVLKLYAEDDLGAHPIFQGDFINFGYWKGLDLTGPITLDARVRASQALYQVVFDQFPSRADLVVAEIGCGRGQGCAFLSENPNVRSITGVDLNEQQIARAERIRQSIGYSHAEKIRFQQGSGDDTGLETGMFDVIYSVEASQHFPSFEDFLIEAHRLLKPGGLLVHTTFFAINAASEQSFKELFLTAGSGVDHFRPLTDVKSACGAHGFSLTLEKSIGADVFYGFDQWTSQLDENNQEAWVHNLLRGYEKDLIDYNVLSSQKKQDLTEE